MHVENENAREEITGSLVAELKSSRQLKIAENIPCSCLAHMFM